MFRKVYDFIRLLISELTAKRVFDSAAALTYSTILAIVPIMAVVFAVARGFGYSKYIETCRDNHWLCQFLPCPHQEWHYSRSWFSIHAMDRADAGE